MNFFDWPSFSLGVAAGGLAVMFIVGLYLYWVPENEDNEQIY